MPWIGAAAARRLARGTAAFALCTVAGCSGTVEASYRPPPPPPPTPAPTTVPPTPTPTPAAPAACGPDQVSVEVGGVQTDGTGRAVPLLIRANTPVPCGLANPVGIELLDADGKPLRTRVQTAELPSGRAAVEAVAADKPVMVWLQWRSEPSSSKADPATDCVAAQRLLLSLDDAVPPIPIEAKVTACDGGTVYVSPAEANTAS